MLFDHATLIAFVLATLAIYIAPGPDMAYIATNSMSRGATAGAWAAIGVTSGVWLQALAAAFGVSVIFKASPWAFELVRWVGVGYLCYLGVKLLRGEDEALVGREPPPLRPFAIWLKGLGINLLNPKISIFFLSFLPQFVDPARGEVFRQLITLSLGFSIGAVAWTLFQAVAFAKLGRMIAGHPRAQAWQRRITGSTLIGFAGMLAVSGVRR